MAKAKSTFFCTDCGHETSGWLGKCPGCGSWNTMQESLKTDSTPKSGKRGTWVSSEDDGAKPAPSSANA